MAEVVTRLVVDSQEYDNKIKRAAEGIQHYAAECKKAGMTMKYMEKEDLEFIKSLGKMDTAAMTSTEKLAEMKKAFVDLSAVYKGMSLSEKLSEPGRALSKSLGQIKGNIGELSGYINDAQGDLSKAGGFSNMLAESLGKLGPAGQMAGKLLKGAFGPVGIAIAAVAGVVQQLVAAFKRNESAMASAERAAAPFKAIWQQIQRLFDRMVPAIASGMEKIADVFKSITERITGWLGKLGQTKLGKKLGLDDLYEKLKKVGEENEKLTESNEKIATKKQSLNEYTRKAESQNARDNTKISELRYKASDKDAYSSDERIGFTKEAMELEGKILQRNLAIKQKELELIKLKNSLIGTGTDGLNEQNDAVIAVEQAQQAYNQHMRTMERELVTMQKQDRAEKRAQIEEDANEQIAALDRQTMEEQAYADEVYNIKKTMYENIAKLYDKDSKEYAKVMSQKAQLDIQYQGTQMRLANKTNSGSGKDPELTALEKRNKRIQELTASIAEMNNILSTSTDANEKAWATNQLQAYNDELDRLNGKLKETATNVTELPTKFELMQESLDKMSTGIGAISTIGNAFNELKGIGEDLASAFSGEMDAWDSLMTVFNSGISIMQTVIGVMEAINTLQELSSTLSKKKVADQAAETTAVVTGKGTEAAANLQEAGTSMVSAGANAAESSSAAGKAVAGIPIVGPILAVAAIAAVLAATFAAMSKAKSAGKFAQGGIIPGNSFSGDNQIASVNAGELILSRSQQATIAGQLQGAAQQTIMVEGRISGKDILLSANNTNRAAGGSRGYYTKVK